MIDLFQMIPGRLLFSDNVSPQYIEFYFWFDENILPFSLSGNICNKYYLVYLQICLIYINYLPVMANCTHDTFWFYFYSELVLQLNDTGNR